MEAKKIKLASRCAIWFSWYCLFALSALSLVVVIQAQENDARPVQLSKSDSVKFAAAVTVQLEFAGGIKFQATQALGSVIRVEQNGSTIGIVPEVDGDRVNARVFNFGFNAKGLTLGESLGSLQIGKEPKEFTKDQLGFQIRLTSITKQDQGKEPKQTSSIHRLRVDESDNNDECCLTCSGVTVCAGSVTGACGSVCVGSLC